MADVIDAEYSKMKDILVYVSPNPAKLNIFKSLTIQTESVTLDYNPSCVSVASNGEFAVVVMMIT